MCLLPIHIIFFQCSVHSNILLTFNVSFIIELQKFFEYYICCSVAKFCRLLATPWTAACQASLSFTTSRSLLKLMSIELAMPSNHLILCRPFFFLLSIFRSMWIFSNDLSLHIKWQKYWTFTFSISLYNEYSGRISFRIDWLDLLAVQGTLKGLLQHHNSKASILQCSGFFIVQLSHLYMTIGNHNIDYMDLCWQSDVSAF